MGSDLQWPSAILFVLTFGILLGLLMKWKKIPWVIAICAVGIAIGWTTEQGWISWGGSTLNFQTLGKRFTDIRFELFLFPAFNDKYLSTNFFSSAVSIAFVAILETLISAKVADSMTKTHFKQRREVFGLGLANFVTGIFGGIPATAALARTALNIRSGATSRVSAILNVIFVVFLSLVLLRFFKHLPLPVVAGIIVVVAWRMVDHNHFVRFWKLDKTVFCLSILCAVVCIVRDPTSGIVVGMILSLLIFSDTVGRVHSELVMTDENGRPTYVSDKEIIVKEKELEVEIQRETHLKSLQDPSAVPPAEREVDVEVGEDGEGGDGSGDIPRVEYHEGIKTVIYRISGQLTYINGYSHRTRLTTSFSDAEFYIISLRYVYFIDVDGLEVLSEMIEDLERMHKHVLVSGVNLSIVGMLSKANWFRALAEKKGKKQIVFKTYHDALRFIQEKKARKARKEAKKNGEEPEAVPKVVTMNVQSF